MSYNICVYAICKNESAFVDRWMDSMSESDLVVVTDTGSTDDTVEKLRQRGAKVYSEDITPWRFDTARNISLEHVPANAEICVCTDLDEVFEAGWRKRLEAAWKPSCTRGRYLFTSDYNEDKTPRKQFIKEKVHRRHDFKWVHPVHEVLEYTGTDSEMSVFISGMVLNHYPDLSKPRTQYLPLLELSAKENPNDAQTIFWLGREYSYYGKHNLCIETLKNYLNLQTANWNEERSAAMRLIASAYEAKGMLGEARAWIYRAVAECPEVREPYMLAAKFGYRQSNWPLVYAMVRNGLSVVKQSKQSEQSSSYLAETECRGYTFYDLGAISAYNLGMLYESREYAVSALSYAPQNQRLQNNLKLIEAKINSQNDAEGKADESI